MASSAANRRLPGAGFRSGDGLPIGELRTLALGSSGARGGPELGADWAVWSLSPTAPAGLGQGTELPGEDAPSPTGQLVAGGSLYNTDRRLRCGSR